MIKGGTDIYLGRVIFADSMAYQFHHYTRRILFERIQQKVEKNFDFTESESILNKWVLR